jgi:hypothetical protein
VKKATLKTKATAASVAAFIAKQDDARRADCKAIDAMFRRVTGQKGKMWGTSIIGYGSQTLTYPSGRSLDWMLTGWSPRKANLTLYLQGGLAAKPELVKKLGTCTTGKGCLYIKRLGDIDQSVLEELVRASVIKKKARRQ